MGWDEITLCDLDMTSDKHCYLGLDEIFSFKMGSWDLVQDAPYQGCSNPLFRTSHHNVVDNEEFFSACDVGNNWWWVTTLSLIMRGHHLSHLWHCLVSPHTTSHHCIWARENVPDYLIPVSLDTVIHQLQFKITAKTQPHISVCLLWRYYQLTQFLLVISLGLEFAWGLIIVRRLQRWPSLLCSRKLCSQSVSQSSRFFSPD